MEKITIQKPLFPFSLSNINRLVYILIMLLITTISGNLQAQCNETVHYTEDFDGQDWLLGSGTDNAGNAIDNCWNRNPDSGSDFFWVRQIGSTNTSKAGPNADNTTGSYNFIYTESNTFSVAGNATFTTPLIDISGFTNPELRFFYHQYGTDINSLNIQLDDGSGFTEVDNIAGQQQTANNDSFLERIIDLSSFSGSIEVRFKATKGIGGNGDIAIDDFEVRENTSTSTNLVSTSPVNKENGIDQSASIILNFDQSVSQSQLANAIVVIGSESGPISGSIVNGGTTSLTFDPNDDFYPGEEVSVYLGNNLIDNSPQSFQFRVKTNDLGTENLNFNTTIIDDSADLPYNVVAANLDNDPELEIASVNSDDNEVVWYDQDFTKNVISSNLLSNGRDITAADIDQDGDIDLITAAFLNDRIDWFENDGNGNFTLNNISTNDNQATQVYIADIDGDLDLDIISASRSDDEIYLHENDGAQNFTRSTIVNQSGLKPWNIDLGDLDQDGDVDIVVSSSSDGIFYLINDGSANFTINTLELNSGSWGVKTVDMENDGDVDIVAAIIDENEIVWFENDGSLNFTRNVILSNIAEPRRAIPVDLNGDGDIDIAYSTSGDDSANGTDDGQIGILNNGGSQNFTEQVLDTQVDFAIGINPVDLNNDNKFEILAGLGGSDDAINADEIRLYEIDINNVWTGAVSSVWEDNNNWSQSSVPSTNDRVVIPDQTNDPIISSDAVAQRLTIETGAVLTINSTASIQVDGLIENNAEIIFKSDGKGTAQIGEFSANGSISGTGEVLVERFVPKSNRAFRYLASSVNTTGTINDNLQEGATTADANPDPNPGFGTHITGGTPANGFDVNPSGEPSMFTWDEVNQDWVAVTSTNQPGDEMSVGDPYALFIRGDRSTDLSVDTPAGPETILRFTGNLEVGDQSVSNLTSTTGDFNLIANPYQAIVDMKLLLESTDASDLNQQYIYVYDPRIGTSGSYTTIDLSLTDAISVPSGTSADENIVPNQAFLVETTGNNPQLTFKENYKNIDANFLNTFNDVSEIRIDLRRQPDDVIVDGVAARFSPNYSNNVNNTDAEDIQNFDESVALFNANNFLSIEKRATPVQNDVIQIYTENYLTDTYEWQIDISNIDLSNLDAVLVDDYLVTETPLNEDGLTNISFTIDNDPQSSDPSRFSIKFIENLGVDDPEKTNFDVYPNPVTNDQFSISGLSGNGDATIQLFDMTGKLVFSKTQSADHTMTIELDQSLPTGVYQLNISQDQSDYQSSLIIAE